MNPIAVDFLQEAAEELKFLRKEIANKKTYQNNHNQLLTIQAGNAGVWIAACASIVSFVSCIFMSIYLIDLSARIRTAQDHLSAIYSIAPELSGLEFNKFIKPQKEK